MSNETSCDFKGGALHDEIYQAPWLVAGIYMTWLWAMGWPRLVKHCPALLRWEFLLNFWTPISISLVVFYAFAVRGMIVEVLLPTDLLDPKATEDYVRQMVLQDQDYVRQMSCNETEADQYAFSNWTSDWANEDTKAKPWEQILRWWGILSPLWTLLTILVCITHTCFHVARVHNNNVVLARIPKESRESDHAKDLEEANLSHREIIWVLALPAVYSLMSMKGVIRMQQAAVNHIGTWKVRRFRNYESREFLVSQMYETNAYVGDLYETWCLIALARLLLRMLQKACEEYPLEVQVMPGLPHFSSSSSSQPGIDKLTQPLVGAVSEISMVGIKSFYYVCMIQAIWYILGCQMAYSGLFPEMFSLDGEKGRFWQLAFYDTFYYLDYGAGLVSSFVAIYDLIALEHHFLPFYKMVHFGNVSAKFWATKVLVSLAFIQSIVKKFFPFTEVQNNLFFASLLTLECLLIAIAHCFAWAANEKWLEQDDRLEIVNPNKRLITIVEAPLPKADDYDISRSKSV